MRTDVQLRLLTYYVEWGMCTRSWPPLLFNEEDLDAAEA